MLPDDKAVTYLTAILRSCIVSDHQQGRDELSDLLCEMGCSSSVKELLYLLVMPRNEQRHFPTRDLTDKERDRWCDANPLEHCEPWEWLRKVSPHSPRPCIQAYPNCQLHRAKLLACWLCGRGVPNDWVQWMLSHDVRSDFVGKCAVPNDWPLLSPQEQQRRQAEWDATR